MYSKTIFFLLSFIAFIGNVKAQSPYNRLCYDGVSLEKNNDFVGAKIKYSQAISLKSDEVRAYLFRGKVSYRLEEYQDAVMDLTKVLSLDAKNSNALSVRGRSYMKLEQWKSAIDDQTKVLALISKKDSLYIPTLGKRAHSYYMDGQFSASIADLTTLITDQLVASKEVNIEHYRERGTAYFKIEKYTEAVADLEAVKVKYPNDRSNLYMLGLTYYKKGDKENAKKIAERYMEVDPTKEEIFSKENALNLFDYEANKVNYRKDFEDIKAQMEELEKIPSANLKEIESQELYVRGKSVWDRLVIPFPDDVVFKDSVQVTLKELYAGLIDKPTIQEEARKFVVQANSATQAKSYDEAIYLYMKSLMVEPCYHLAYYNLGLLYAQKGMYPAAIKQMKEYLKVYPNAPDKRAAQDLIYEWEGKQKGSTSVGYYDPELVNSMKDNQADQVFFIASYGFVKPLGNATKFVSTETIEERFFSSGKLGMQNGFYVEMGGGGGSYTNDKYVGVLFELLLRYRHHKLDWKAAGGIFSDPATVSKDFRFMEISEKIGMWVRPAQNLFISFYYAPALVMQFDTEFSNDVAGQEKYYYSVKSEYVRLSHTLGASLKYRFLSIGYEWDYVPMKMDIRSYYENYVTGFKSDVTVTGKSNIKFGTVRLSFYL